MEGRWRSLKSLPPLPKPKMHMKQIPDHRIVSSHPVILTFRHPGDEEKSVAHGWSKQRWKKMQFCRNLYSNFVRRAILERLFFSAVQPSKMVRKMLKKWNSPKLLGREARSDQASRPPRTLSCVALYLRKRDLKKPTWKIEKPKMQVQFLTKDLKDLE